MPDAAVNDVLRLAFVLKLEFYALAFELLLLMRTSGPKRKVQQPRFLELQWWGFGPYSQLATGSESRSIHFDTVGDLRG